MDLKSTGKIFYNITLKEIKASQINRSEEVYEITEIDAKGNLETYELIIPYTHVDTRYDRQLKIYEEILGSKRPGVGIRCSQDPQIQTIPFGIASTFKTMVRKPVIAFRGFKDNTKICLKVNYSGQFNAFYPQPTRLQDSLATWNGFVNGDNSFVNENNKKYPYIFWDGFRHNLDPKVVQKGDVVATQDLEEYLEKKCFYAGLDFTLTADFVSFWLPILAANQVNQIYFLSIEECNKVAAMEILTETDFELTRFYMVFKPVSKMANSFNQQKFKKSVQKTIKAKITEWGGFEV